MLTYAVNNLGVEHVAVVGHTFCGGAAACHRAAVSPEPSSGTSTSTALGRWLEPMTTLARDLDLGSLDNDKALRLLVEENVKAQVGHNSSSGSRGGSH